MKMFRRVINLYLMAVLLAGPSLCCCSLSHASTTDSQSTHSCGQDASAHSCCASNDDTNDEPVKSDHCPCRKHHEQQVLSGNDTVSAASARLTTDNLTPSFHFGLIPAGELAQARDLNLLAQQKSDADSPSSRDLLRGFSVMRC